MDLVEDLPTYESNNFKLTKGNHRFFYQKPIIPIPSSDLDYWKLNNFTTHSHVNAQLMENYDNSGYNKKSFENKNQLHVDEICYATNFTISKTSTYLLQLEFSNVIKSLPGKIYQLNR